jgi:hypothetical protein
MYAENKKEIQENLKDIKLKFFNTQSCVKKYK